MYRNAKKSHSVNGAGHFLLRSMFRWGWYLKSLREWRSPAHLMFQHNQCLVNVYNSGIITWYVRFKGKCAHPISFRLSETKQNNPRILFFYIFVAPRMLGPFCLTSLCQEGIRWAHLHLIFMHHVMSPLS